MVPRSRADAEGRDDVNATAERVHVVEAGIAETRAKLDAAELELQAAEAKLVDLDDMRAGAVAGDLDPDEVEAHAAECETKRGEAAATIKRMRGTLAALEPKLADARQQVADDDLDAVTGELAEASKAAAALAGRQFAGVLEAAVKQAVKLLEARAAVTELEEQVTRAARLAGHEGRFPGDAPIYERFTVKALADETDWRPAGWERLTVLLQAGPSTPVSDAEARLHRDDHELANRDRVLIREAALETLQTPRLRVDEPFDDVIDRVLEEHGLEDRRADIVAVREALVLDHLAAVELDFERSEASFQAAAASGGVEVFGASPPTRVLDEFEILWRRQNGIRVVLDGDVGSLEETGVVTL